MGKHNYLVSEVMSPAAVTVTPETRVAQVLQLSASKNIHHFPIVAGKKAIGLVCTCDLTDAATDGKVWQFARHPPVAVSPSSSARKVARLMNQYAVGSVVVTTDDGLCGIVTRRDLLSAEPRLAQLMGESHCTVCSSVAAPRLDGERKRGPYPGAPILPPAHLLRSGQRAAQRQRSGVVVRADIREAQRVQSTSS